MHLSFQMTDDILVASAFGELDHHSAALVREEIDKTMETFQCKNLIFDVSKVTFMDSSGIGVVLGRYNKVKQKEGTIYMTGCSEYVKRILDMSGVFTVINEEQELDTAIDKIKGQEQLKLEVTKNE